MTDPNDDARCMALALALGRRGLGRTWPNPAVGAVLVRAGSARLVIVGRGWTQPGGRPHAETEALRQAGAAAQGATLYVTLEPCSHHGATPPCADAIVKAGITRVVSAIEDPNPQVAGAGHRRLREAGIAVDIGLGATEAQQAHAGHIRRVRDGRPHVMLKLALSADDKVGLSGRQPVAITGEAVRQRVHLMRATSDAVLTGIGTVLADDPLLTCRLPGMQDRSPLRVVLDSGLRISRQSRLLASAGASPVWLVASEAASAEREEELRRGGIEILRAPQTSGRLDLAAVLALLAGRGITRLMVEAGPMVAAALVMADLVDEAVLFRSPNPIGPDGLDALYGLPLDALSRSGRLTKVGTEMVGEDTAETLRRWRGD